MSNLERIPGHRMTRAQREKRAFQLLVGGSALGVVAVVGIVLAAVGVIGSGLPVLAAVLAVVCFVLFRRTVGS